MVAIALLIAAYFVMKAIQRIYGQYTHLNDTEIQDVMLNRLDKNGPHYSRLIRHLGICEDCQERLHSFEEGGGIEDHLVD